MTCLTTYNVGGFCACGKPMEPAHLVDSKPYCAACCPVHKDADHEWQAPAPPSGEQGSLFEKEGEYPE